MKWFNSLNAKVAIKQKPETETAFYIMATLAFNELMYVLESKKNDSRM